MNLIYLEALKIQTPNLDRLCQASLLHTQSTVLICDLLDDKFSQINHST